MSGAFSTPAEHAFDHPELEDARAVAGPSSNGDAVQELSIEEAFEVKRTIEFILAAGYKTIGLQFPDELLPSSVPVYRAIQKGIAHTGAQAYVLADSTYGSLPVHYVFPRQTLDTKDAASILLEASKEELEDADGSKEGIVVVWDVAYDWLSGTYSSTHRITLTYKDEIIKELTQAVSVPISFATIRRSQTGHSRQIAASNLNAAEGICTPGAPVNEVRPPSPRSQEKAPSLRSIDPPSGLTMRDCVIWYIGEEGRARLNLQMQNADSSIYSYSSSSRSATLLTTTSRALQRRLLSIHHAVSSDIFGLVVHSVGLTSSKPLLDKMRALLKKRRKKSYTLTVGRLNPAKLANFETVECFVLVGCQEGGLVDSKDFLRPIITPWELLLALQGPEHEWEPGQWTLDMSKVLAEAQKSHQASHEGTDGPGNAGSKEGDQAEDDGPVFSLVDGTYKSRKLFGTDSRGKSETLENGMGQMTLRNQELSLAKLESAGSNYLSSRHFQGLEVRYGEDEPAQLEEGRSGIARGYAEEK